MKILVTLPYWEGDKAMMEKTVNLACDLQEEFVENIELMFVPRFDSSDPSTAIRVKASQKFGKVHLWKCTRVGVGFPHGCNELAYGILNHVPMEKHLNPKAYVGIDAMLIFEADCVFLKKNWGTYLHEEWAAARAAKKLIAGPVIPSCPPHTQEHVNAVALWSWDVTKHLKPLLGGPPLTGWDNYHGPITVPVTHPSKLFVLDYRKDTITPEELFKNKDALVYHGVKDDSAIRAVREKCLTV
jgi:hypothetical protein